MEGKKNCTKMKSDDTLKTKPSWKYRIIDFHKDILCKSAFSEFAYQNS